MNSYRIILLAFLCFLCGSSYAFDAQEEELLKAIQRDEYLKPHFTYESSIANFAQKEQCLQIPHSLHKGEPQRNKNAFKWVIDVPVESSNSNYITNNIVKLDALVIAGLISKELVTLEIESEIKRFIRYRLTVKGWEAQAGSCFTIGKARHLKVNRINKLEIPIGEGKKDTAYKVVVLVGFSDFLSLPEWTNHSEMRKAFPLINKLINGYEREILMKKESGHWHEYLSPEKLKRMAKSGSGRSESYYSKNQPKTNKDIILKAFLFDEHSHPAWSCISLPGESSNGQLRVDKILGTHKSYSVAIDDNSVREKWDTIESKTKPYLERLVDAGLLTSHTQDKIYVGKEGRGKYFSGTVYQISPSYSHIVDEKRGCIYLGKGVVNIVKLEILAGNTRNVPFGRESVRYKYIMKFPSPPEWAKDKVLQAAWSDLKGALEYGYACEGQFEIDLIKEYEGGGRCWWAYNSLSEL